MSEKTKFKVCKTDLGMDKVYPEGSIVELDEKQDWVWKLVFSGNLEPYADPEDFEKELAEAEYPLKLAAELVARNIEIPEDADVEMMEKLLREDEYKPKEVDSNENEIQSSPAKEDKPVEDGKIQVEVKSRNSGRTAKQKDKN